MPTKGPEEKKFQKVAPPDEALREIQAKPLLGSHASEKLEPFSQKEIAGFMDLYTSLGSQLYDNLPDLFEPQGQRRLVLSKVSPVPAIKELAENLLLDFERESHDERIDVYTKQVRRTAKALAAIQDEDVMPVAGHGEVKGSELKELYARMAVDYVLESNTWVYIKKSQPAQRLEPKHR